MTTDTPNPPTALLDSSSIPKLFLSTVSHVNVYNTCCMAVTAYLQNLIYIQYVPPAWFSHAWQRVCFFLPADCESYDSDSWLRACRFRAKLVLDLLAWQGLNRESRCNRLWMDGRCNFALSTVTLINNVKCYFSTGSSSHMERKITTVSLNTVYWDKTKL